MKKFIVAIAAFAMLTGSAYAADWNFYGNARVQTFYVDVDPQDGSGSAKNTTWDKLGTGRIGANVKVSDELTGRFEYGSANSVNLRLLYGEWNFGAGSLRIGQDWVPTTLWASGQAYNDAGLGGWGELGGGRAAQIKLIFGGFRLAFVAPKTDVVGGTTEEVKIPQIAAKYILAGENWSVSATGAYQTFDIDDESVNSYVIGAMGGVSFGAANINLALFGGENLANLYNAPDVSGAATDGQAQLIAGKVADNEALGFRVVGTYAFNDMVSAELGYGYTSTELDIAGADKDKMASYYLSVPIVMAPGVVVSPEVGVIDYEEDNQSKTTYFGAKWQINF